MGWRLWALERETHGIRRVHPTTWCWPPPRCTSTGLPLLTGRSQPICPSSRCGRQSLVPPPSPPEQSRPPSHGRHLLPASEHQSLSSEPPYAHHPSSTCTGP